MKKKRVIRLVAALISAVIILNGTVFAAATTIGDAASGSDAPSSSSVLIDAIQPESEPNESAEADPVLLPQPQAAPLVVVPEDEENFPKPQTYGSLLDGLAGAGGEGDDTFSTLATDTSSYATPSNLERTMPNLRPNLAGDVTTGAVAYVSISGSDGYDGKTIFDVQYKIHTDNAVLIDHTSATNDMYSFAVDAGSNGKSGVLTVKKVDGEIVNGKTVEFGDFAFYFQNGEQNGASANIWLSSMTATVADIDGNPALDADGNPITITHVFDSETAPVQTYAYAHRFTATASASHKWLAQQPLTNGTANIGRTFAAPATSIFGKDKEISVADLLAPPVSMGISVAEANKFAAGMPFGATLNAAAPPATGYVAPVKTTYHLQFILQDDLKFPAALVAALNADTYVQVYDMASDDTLAAFKSVAMFEEFTAGSNAKVYAKLGQAPEADGSYKGDIRLKVEQDIPAGTLAAGGKLKITNLYFRKAFTDSESTVYAAIRMLPNTTDFPATTVAASGDTFALDVAKTAIGEVEIRSLKIAARMNINDQALAYAKSFAKTTGTWKYYVNVAAENNGFTQLDATSTELSYAAERTYTSGKAVFVPKGATMDERYLLNRIWFSTSSATLSEDLGIKKISIEEKPMTALDANDGYNPNEMYIVGFTVPIPKEGTKVVVNIKFSDGSTTALTLQGTEAEVITAIKFFASDKGLTAENVDGIWHLLPKGGGINPKSLPSADYALKRISSVQLIVERVDTNKEISISNYPKFLFEMNPMYTIPTPIGGIKPTTKEFDNYIKTTLTLGDNSEVLAVSDVAKVLYKDELNESVFMNKIAVNETALASGNPDRTAISGDVLTYTVTMELKKENTDLGYVDGLWLLDRNYGGLVFAPNYTADVNITEGTHAKGSTVALDTAKHNPATSPVGASYPKAYTGAKPALSGMGITNASGTHEMVFAFTGRMHVGDTITITYKATVADITPEQIAAAAGQSIKIKNSVLIQTFTGSGGIIGGGGGGTPSWPAPSKDTEIGSEVPAEPASIIGDVTIKTSKTHVANGEPYDIIVTGGAFLSPKDFKNPVFVLPLYSNTNYATQIEQVGIVNVKLVTYSFTKDAQNIWVRKESASTDVDSNDYSVQYYDITGALLTTAQLNANMDSARYVRVEYKKSLLAGNQTLQFPQKVSSKTLNIGNDVGTAAQAMSLSHVAQWTAYLSQGENGKQTDKMSALGLANLFTSADWPTPVSTLASEAVTTTLAKVFIGGNTTKPTVAIPRLKSSIINVHTFRYTNCVEITQGVTSTKPEYYLGDDVEYSVTLRNLRQEISNILAGNTYLPKNIVLNLPVGQILNATSLNIVANVTQTFTDADYSYTTRNIIVDGKTIQQIILEFKATAPKINFGSSLIITYSAKVDNLELNNGAHKATGYARASLYYDATTTLSKSGNNGHDIAANTWWNWTSAPAIVGANNIHRAQASASVIHSNRVIIPGISKASVPSPITNSYGSFVKWKTTVSNSTGAEVAMKNFYVVDVLPQGFTLRKTLNTTPAPTGTYVNQSGQQVIYWLCEADGAATGLAASKTLSFEYETAIDITMVGAVTGNSYVVLKTDDNGYFSSGKIGSGTFVDTLDREFAGIVSELQTTSRGVCASTNINLTTAIGAIATESIKNEAGDLATSGGNKLIDVSRGEKIDFVYDLKNGSNQAIYEDLELYNYLPMENDTTALSGATRGSVWAPTMNEGTLKLTLNGVDVDANDFVVYYTGSTKTAAKPQNLAWTLASDWVSLNPGKSPAAFKIAFTNNRKLTPSQELKLTWSMTVPSNLAYEKVQTMALNTMAYRFNVDAGAYNAEPVSIGIVLLGQQNLVLNFKKTLSDNDNSTNQTFTFLIEKQNQFIATEWNPLVVKTIMPNANSAGNIQNLHSDNDAQNNGKFTIALENGQTRGIIIPGLAEGNYRVTEIGADAKFTVAGSGTEILLNAGSNNSTLAITNTYYKAPPVVVVPPVVVDPPVVLDPPVVVNPPVVVAPPRIPFRPIVPVVPVVPVTPPVVIETPTTIPEVEIPTVQDSAPQVLEEELIPQANPGASWSLLNLLCALFGVLIALITVIRLIAKRRKEAPEDEQNAEVGGNQVREKGGEVNVKDGVLQTSIVVFGLLTLIVTLILENFKLPMIFVNIHSWIIVPLFIVDLVVLVLYMLAKNKEDNDADALEDA